MCTRVPKEGGPTCLGLLCSECYSENHDRLTTLRQTVDRLKDTGTVLSGLVTELRAEVATLRQKTQWRRCSEEIPERHPIFKERTVRVLLRTDIGGTVGFWTEEHGWMDDHGQVEGICWMPFPDLPPFNPGDVRFSLEEGPDLADWIERMAEAEGNALVAAGSPSVGGEAEVANDEVEIPKMLTVAEAGERAVEAMKEMERQWDQSAVDEAEAHARVDDPKGETTEPKPMCLTPLPKREPAMVTCPLCRGKIGMLSGIPEGEVCPACDSTGQVPAEGGAE